MAKGEGVLHGDTNETNMERFPTSIKMGPNSSNNLCTNYLFLSAATELDFST